MKIKRKNHTQDYAKDLTVIKKGWMERLQHKRNISLNVVAKTKQPDEEIIIKYIEEKHGIKY